LRSVWTRVHVRGGYAHGGLGWRKLAFHCCACCHAKRAVLKWRQHILGSVHAAVQEALLNALQRLPFGKGIIQEELPLFMDTLLEFRAELVALGEADEGSDLEVDKQNETRVLNARSRYCLRRMQAKPKQAETGVAQGESSEAEEADARDLRNDREG